MRERASEIGRQILGHDLRAESRPSRAVLLAGRELAPAMSSQSGQLAAFSVMPSRAEPSQAGRWTQRREKLEKKSSSSLTRRSKRRSLCRTRRVSLRAAPPTRLGDSNKSSGSHSHRAKTLSSAADARRGPCRCGWRRLTTNEPSRRHSPRRHVRRGLFHQRHRAHRLYLHHQACKPAS